MRYFLFLVTILAHAQVATLQIQVVEGEGAVHSPGSRSTRPLTVAVTDETGRPVAHAAVSFHLPGEGPGGVFLNGLGTEVEMTDGSGRATVRGLQSNHSLGRFEIRIVATLEQAHAGIVSFQYVGDSAGGKTDSAPPAKSASRGYTKWILVASAIVVGATAGIVSGAKSKNAPASAAATPSAGVTLTIGTPTITVGKP